MSVKNKWIANRSWKRLVYVLIGGLTAISAFMQTDWLFGIFGLFFAFMGIFGLGCAGSSCEIDSYDISPKSSNNHSLNQEISYEEIK